MSSNNKEVINQELFFNEQDDDFLFDLLTINELQKEDFDWFNNLQLNYTPTTTNDVTSSASTTTTTITTSIVNENSNIEQKQNQTETTNTLPIEQAIVIVENNKNDIPQISTTTTEIITNNNHDQDKNEILINQTIIQPQLSSSNIIIEQINKKKLEKSLKPKEKTIKNFNKIKKCMKTSSTTSTSNDNNGVTNINCNNNNKKFLLKRSRKRSKPIIITPTNSIDEQTQLFASLPQQQEQLTILNPVIQQQQQQESTNFLNKKNELEPSNKKFAIETNKINNNFVNKCKNVDFQIEQFSQLDLHSSEDDSEFLIRNYNRKVKKPINNSNLNSEFNQQEITKRTRYSSSESDTRFKINNNENQLIKQSNINLLQQKNQIILNNNNNNNNNLRQNTNYIQTPKTSQKDIDKLIQLLKESSSLSSNSCSSSTSSYTSNNNGTIVNNNNNNNNNLNGQQIITSDTNNSSNESNDLSNNNNKNSKRKKLVPKTNITRNSDEFSLNDFKSLDINSDYDYEISNFINENTQMTSSNSSSSVVNREDRQMLWNSIKTNTNYNEIINEVGSLLAEKMTFWDLVKLKLKYGNNKLKTTYDIIDDYTLLYSNMSKLLENFVNQHSSQNSFNVNHHNKSDNSSRSRSSSRNYRKTTNNK